MDRASILGVSLGLFAIIGAILIESNSFLIAIQPMAALVVFGGSLGATFLNFSSSTIISAFKSVKKVFIEEENTTFSVVEQIMTLANIARKDGLLSLTEHIYLIEDDFLRRGIQLALDINNPQLLKEILNTETHLEEEKELMHARIFEAIGGFAPTFGIIGAIIGLIQVMGNLQDPAHLGKGIAEAFVATIYGVGSANLLFLPIAGKLKMKTREQILLKEMTTQGIVSIHVGENPAILEEKLFTFINITQRENSFIIENQPQEELINNLEY